MGSHKKNPKFKSDATKAKLNSMRKEHKRKLQEKRARLVARNLPFGTTEENLKEHFSAFGEIDNVQLVKRADGSLVGCGFIQYKLVQKAAKARHHLNGKIFMGRSLSVDFAKPKDKYKTNSKIKKEPKEEPEVKIKPEPVDVSDLDGATIEIKDEDLESVKGEFDEDMKEELDEEENEEEMKEELDDEEEDEFSEEEEGIDEKFEVKPERKRFQSHDVSEGKTVFVKNIPFSADNNDLKECMEQFGPVHYALICIDKLTEHSKGSGFVKFQNVDDAEKALSAGTELKLLDNILDCHKAIDRDEITKKANMKKESKEMPKDSRNLFLVKEGLVMAGSKAAEGVSGSDMAKRLQLEQYKTQMLRNLNKFISQERLVIHNIPPGWDDRRLKALVQQHCPQGATIREVRIMRDMKNLDASGRGKSKEFGFVGFTKHEHALTTLRAINNNPDIFTPQRRPIVAFSIENKSMLRFKEKRLEVSQKKNPTSTKFDAEYKKASDKRKKQQNGELSSNAKDFEGEVAKPGVPKMRNRFKLNMQAKLHHQNLKKQKQREKFTKQKTRETIKQSKQKENKKKEDDHFSKMVADYKSKLIAPANKKGKWYQGTG